MHSACLEFLESIRDHYPQWFTKSRVVEFGSYDVNGTIRPAFEDCDYVGVDWRAGPLVDVVSFAHEAPLVGPYDVVCSASMLEHDLYWEKSISKMVSLMAPDGLLIVSWGAAENPPHEGHAAPDNLFHALPAGKLLRMVIKDFGLHVHKFVYECEWATRVPAIGGVQMFAVRDAAQARGPRLIHKLHPADQEGLSAEDLTGTLVEFV